MHWARARASRVSDEGIEQRPAADTVVMTERVELAGRVVELRRVLFGIALLDLDHLVVRAELVTHRCRQLGDLGIQPGALGHPGRDLQSVGREAQLLPLLLRGRHGLPEDQPHALVEHVVGDRVVAGLAVIREEAEGPRQVGGRRSRVEPVELREVSLQIAGDELQVGIDPVARSEVVVGDGLLLAWVGFRVLRVGLGLAEVVDALVEHHRVEEMRPRLRLRLGKLGDVVAAEAPSRDHEAR